MHFKIIGVLLIALALVHIFFPKYFTLDKELKSLSLINRQMMTVDTFFIALAVLLMTLLCLTSSAELNATNLSKKT
jgi:DMSO/TMAO reductase YedYZ heme-binding membrane subunit